MLIVGRPENRKLRGWAEETILKGFRSWLLLAGCLAAFASAAHTRSQSHSVWELNGSDIDLVMTVPVIEADRITGTTGAPNDDQVTDYLLARVYPLSKNRRCALVPPVATLSAAQGFRKFDFTFHCDSALDLKLHFGAFFERMPSHTNFAQVQNTANGEFTEQLFTDEHQTVEMTGGVGSRLKSARFFEFVRMGTMHIFTGVDHMSFLLGLVLISRRLRDLVFVVTGFTIGHSLTLALAVTGVVRPHAEYIDALVALTIALIGAENVVIQTRRPEFVAAFAGVPLALMAVLQWLGYGDLPSPLLLGAALFTVNYVLISGKLQDAGRLRILITVIFGLIHGFGFAADVLEMQLPPERMAELLVGFNLGVEAGQLTLVVGVTGLVVALRRWNMALPRPIVVDTASAFLVGLGVFWFVGRSFA